MISVWTKLLMDLIFIAAGSVLIAYSAGVPTMKLIIGAIGVKCVWLGMKEWKS